ncbi:MAG: NADAR family protein [Bdellovibrionales bacterium]|nr:NADAR family protein [Bdellovibrionales bacterium]
MCKYLRYEPSWENREDTGSGFPHASGGSFFTELTKIPLKQMPFEMRNTYRIYFLLWMKILLVASACTTTKYGGYPGHWWKEIPRMEAKWWEVLPQDAQVGEVVLSKRNELGILSHFAHTPFLFEGKQYESVEGFWQMLKFPEDEDDPRRAFIQIKWNYTRQEVAKLYSFEALYVGKKADENMERMGINWVSYKGQKMAYNEPLKGELYKLIRSVMWAKLRQNKNVQRVLLETKNLKLIPDYKMKLDTPPVFKYHKMWMEIRDEVIANPQLLEK